MTLTEKRKKQILIVDDDQAVLAGMLRLLCRAGHEVRGAGTAEEGLRMMREQCPDLVLMDVMLPGISGLEAVRQIKADPALASVFVVNMSARLVSRYHQTEGLDAGADGYITRPIANQELLNTVNAFLRLKSMMDALRASEERFRSIIDVNSDGMLIVNQTGTIAFANPASARLFKCSVNDLIGKQFTWMNVSDADNPGEIEIGIGSKGRITLETQVSTIEWESELAFLVSLHDITHRKEAERRIHQLAFYDTLTQLPNRYLLLDRLRKALSVSARSGNKGALLLLDLDNFKIFNDTLGHEQGDHLLQKVASRLSSCVRESDTIARLGGDEFVIILSELSKCSDQAATLAEVACEKILAAFRAPFQLGYYEHFTTPSIGVTLFADQLSSIDELLKQADLSMYQAKSAGGNTIRFFDPEMQRAVSSRIEWESELRQGLQQKAFFLHYQPQVNHLGQVTGGEALVRWQHPRHGVVFPKDFIGLAEETGLIIQLGHRVLESACLQLAAWAARPETAALSIAVNVSARQFRHPEFLTTMMSVIEGSGANPVNLKLELTESLLLDNIEDAIVKMTLLQSKGVRFSLDDFGTGYSSLSYLKRLPLNQLKIDQSFVKDLVEDSSDVAIARTIVTLGHSLGLVVIAEGVETEAQLRLLAEEGCDEFQGYLFSQSVPAEQFESLIHSWG